MEKFFRWIQHHSPELAFLVAGLAAMDAGFDLMAGATIPPILGTMVTVFGGIAAAQWKQRQSDEHEDEEDDDDDNRIRRAR